MSRWSGADGTEVELTEGGVLVRGRSLLAEVLRMGADYASRGDGPRIDVLPPPGGSVNLDLKNVWLVDAWVRGEARLRGIDVTSDYEADPKDAPPEVQALLALEATWFDADAHGVIY